MIKEVPNDSISKSKVLFDFSGGLSSRIGKVEKSNDFILDNKVYNHIENEHKTTQEWPFDRDFHLKINIAVGGMLGGQKGIDDTIFPAQMSIDYVRVFQKSDE